jgi:tRNA uridine 5-carbamoylmethylation protein Kti12
MREYPLWLICGIPCSGKTTFGNWLRDQKAFLHLDLESR